MQETQPQQPQQQKAPSFSQYLPHPRPEGVLQPDPPYAPKRLMYVKSSIPGRTHDHDLSRKGHNNSPSLGNDTNTM